MAVYLVVQDVISNSHQFSQYTQSLESIIQRCGGRMIAISPLDISEAQQTIVFECLSREDAVGFWYSDEYATVRNFQETAPFQALIVEGEIQL
ncbi:DUF1330 domain-containing protein [Nostocaceae cyanobacterium CENA357]|uniref:DUF1330 domain-containing protein n=1 Tax=Atlanticothrix silvestris CENA357 TaxID=1725252 RepID=A0A8J7HJ63_9CYAN|nr:DUF1330 domain-containing protein [Atlanticothrix silvestris]MBH8556109.1 DUF1330 domain-containing protein [Atlanticothrix silvestris CENA357]